MRKLLTLIGICLCLGACADSVRGRGEAREQTGNYGFDTLYRPQYAGGFALFTSGKSTLLQVLNPWQESQGEVKEVFLSRDGEPAPDGFEGVELTLPLQRVVCMSSSYVAFMDALEGADLIEGISGTKFISSPGVQQRISEGRIADVGYDNSINYELLVSLKPDVIFIYGVSGENASITEKLKELGLKIVYIGDYLENTPLGRAEWVTVFGELLGKRDQAQKLFDTIRDQYEEVRTLAAKVKKRPMVMLNTPWRDSWFVPGDRSYMVRLIQDAGGSYACAGVDSDQSRPISTETAYVAASKCDIWLNPGTVTSLSELVSNTPRFKQIGAVTNRQVYNNNARMTPNGGSDFWESGVVYPHVVLRDMIRIFHPNLLPDHTLHFFQKLQ